MRKSINFGRLLFQLLAFQDAENIYFIKRRKIKEGPGKLAEPISLQITTQNRVALMAVTHRAQLGRHY